MQKISPNDIDYLTAIRPIPWLRRVFPSLGFYPGFLAIVWRSGRQAKHGRYVSDDWFNSSFQVLRCLEGVGMRVEISGLDHIRAVDGPMIFIGNHLSVMETVLLPSIILPYKPVTFVIKESLLEVPVFKYVMRACEPIAVTRTNPRLDLKVVLEEGCERLARGKSIIIFPQTTRTEFNPEQFSSIGVKLAKKAAVPIVPLALMTDGWENGAWIKDFGAIRPDRRAHFAFGPAMRVEGKGAAEHQAVIDFIQQHHDRWRQASV